jgi:hypothetical protein
MRDPKDITPLGVQIDHIFPVRMRNSLLHKSKTHTSLLNATRHFPDFNVGDQHCAVTTNYRKYQTLPPHKHIVVLPRPPSSSTHALESHAYNAILTLQALSPTLIVAL